MEILTISNSAELANPAALVRWDEALRAHMAGAIAMRARLDAERVRPAAAPVPRRQRKRSLTKVCEAARKAGADRIIVDGVVIALSPAAAVAAESNGNEFDKWMARHANPTKGN
jgi:hypothetical protein